ncbi:hypothetical protein [Niallia sp. FSL M8-0099]|uniref:hypothetical protein n=1 Tax=Niallia sp. FSL M8-0099 TaxID=2954519 RepID=UPI0030FAB668
MKNFQEFYILGLPIETEIGLCNFIKVKDYPDFILDLQIISMNKNKVIHDYSVSNKKGELNDFIIKLSEMDFFDIVLGIAELREAYVNVFTKVFNDESVLSKITPDNFEYYRNLVLNMQCIKEEIINPNPEIQRAIERSKRVKAQESSQLTFADMVSSVVVGTGIDYEQINNWSIYKLHMTFQRIAVFQNYDTSTLFATVSSEKMKIESWSTHIDLFEEENHFVTQEQFNKSTGSAFRE